MNTSTAGVSSRLWKLTLPLLAVSLRVLPCLGADQDNELAQSEAHLGDVSEPKPIVETKWPCEQFDQNTSGNETGDFPPVVPKDEASRCLHGCVSFGNYMLAPDDVRNQKSNLASEPIEDERVILFNAAGRYRFERDGNVKMKATIKGKVEYLDSDALLVPWSGNEKVVEKWPGGVGKILDDYKIDPEICSMDSELIVLLFEPLNDIRRLSFDKALKGSVDIAGRIIGRDEDGTKLHIRLIDPAVIYSLAELPFVRWIGRGERIGIRNEGTSAIIQSGRRGSRPVFDHGLFGEGEIVGLIDNPFDIRHCFFADWKKPGPEHRKVVFYPNIPVSSVGLDLHGTIVAGILAGEDPASPIDFRNGQAPRAKIAFSPLQRFADVLPASTNALLPKRPETLKAALEELWDKGARIFSLSWGNDACEISNSGPPVTRSKAISTVKTGCRLNFLAGDIDRFTAAHEDSLVVVAVSNHDRITTPENAYNSLAVGASRQFGFTDSSEQNDRAKAFENRRGIGGIGPTFDGRWKPDIFAPGCRIKSAEAGTPCEVADAIADERVVLSGAHEGSAHSMFGKSIEGAAESGESVESEGMPFGKGYPIVHQMDPSVRAESAPSAAAGIEMVEPAIRSGSCATSWAAPAAAGAAALVREYFREGWYPTGGVKDKAGKGVVSKAERLSGRATDHCEPSGALLKAMLIQSSVPMAKVPGGVGVPTQELGFGRLELGRALFFKDAKSEDHDGQASSLMPTPEGTAEPSKDSKSEDHGGQGSSPMLSPEGTGEPSNESKAEDLGRQHSSSMLSPSGAKKPKPSAPRTIVIDVPHSKGLMTGEMGGPYDVHTRNGEIKVTLVWTNPTYSEASPQSRGNDLDLEVTKNDGSKLLLTPGFPHVYCGNNFSPKRGSLAIGRVCDDERYLFTGTERLARIRILRGPSAAE